MKKSIFSLLALLLISCMSVSNVSSQVWTKLGSSKVHGHVDYDEIWVTSSRGDFKAIKLFVENEGIDFDRVVVHFANGGQDQMAIKNFIPAGGETRVMDLKGGDRVIKKVTFYYKSNAVSKPKAKVVLYGRY